MQRPTEPIKAHNHRSSQGGTVIGKEHDPHPLANSSITKDFPQVFYYAEAPDMEVTVEYLGKVLAMEVQA